MIHITENRSGIHEMLDKLDESVVALFGKMTPQHMVEHVSKAMSISNGNLAVPLLVDPARAEKQKRIMIFTDRPFPMGMQAPSLGGNLDVLTHKNLEEAKQALKAELEKFDQWYDEDPERRSMHPFLGDLNHDEWIRFHNKHFTHHFGQFGLI
jgi:oxepin-CoA hydrolase/3-oxo-5,6-dehydrosuberyl-CoA semialdehyde dehydrogenase